MFTTALLDRVVRIVELHYVYCPNGPVRRTGDGAKTSVCGLIGPVQYWNNAMLNRKQTR